MASSRLDFSLVHAWPVTPGHSIAKKESPTSYAALNRIGFQTRQPVSKPVPTGNMKGRHLVLRGLQQVENAEAIGILSSSKSAVFVVQAVGEQKVYQPGPVDLFSISKTSSQPLL